MGLDYNEWLFIDHFECCSVVEVLISSDSELSFSCVILVPVQLIVWHTYVIGLSRMQCEHFAYMCTFFTGVSLGTSRTRKM